MRGDQVLPVVLGQRVVMRDVNEGRYGGPKFGTVTKVGRKLVTVQNETAKWDEKVYRLDTGRQNDRYDHGYFQTIEAFEEGKRRGELLAALREAGLEPRLGAGSQFSTATLARILEVIQSDESTGRSE